MKIATDPDAEGTPHVHVEHYGEGPLVIIVTCHVWPEGNGRVAAAYDDRRSMRFSFEPPGATETAEAADPHALS